MELSLILRRLWRHRILVALGVLLAAVASVAKTFDVSLSPLSIEPRTSQFGAAASTMYVDTSRSAVGAARSNDSEGLVTRAQIAARFIDSGQVKAATARALDIPANQVSVTGPNPNTAGQQQVQPVAQQRANSIISQGSPYTVFVETSASAPTISLFTQAPDAGKAARLAEAITDALRRELATLRSEERQGALAGLREDLNVIEERRDREVSSSERRSREREIRDAGVVLRPLGQPVSGNVSDQSGSAVAIVMFLALVVVWCIGIVAVSGLVRSLRRG